MALLEENPAQAAQPGLAQFPQLFTKRGVNDMPHILGRIGNLEVRLARNSSEIAAAQEIRFRVFYDELGASRRYVHMLEQRDSDRFDSLCDHLLVLDRSISGPDQRQVVATYRLLQQEPGGSSACYSDDEFSLSELIARHPQKRFLELGRSCVLPEYRTKRIVELLWQGIWAYCLHHRIDVMTGCASFHGIFPAAHAEPLSFLAHNCRADAQWDVSALPDRYFPIDLMPSEAVDGRRAIAAMPPLLKGYLRLGARIGDGCVIDHDFRTTDVFVILPVEMISKRYVNHFGTSADRYAA
jgi:putative hemolysin